jgi:hypothetical protein
VERERVEELLLGVSDEIMSRDPKSKVGPIEFISRDEGRADWGP